MDFLPGQQSVYYAQHHTDQRAGGDDCVLGESISIYFSTCISSSTLQLHLNIVAIQYAALYFIVPIIESAVMGTIESRSSPYHLQIINKTSIVCNANGVSWQLHVDRERAQGRRVKILYFTIVSSATLNTAKAGEGMLVLLSFVLSGSHSKEYRRRKVVIAT